MSGGASSGSTAAPPQQYTVNLAALLKACSENGTCLAGLAIPEQKELPVKWRPILHAVPTVLTPAAWHAFDDAGKKMILQMQGLACAQSTYDKMMKDPETNHFAVLAAANIYSMVVNRCVHFNARIGRECDNAPESRDVAGAVTGILARQTTVGKVFHMTFDFGKYQWLVNVLLTMGVMGKLNWFQSGHHTGSSNKAAAESKALVKYARRMIDSCPELKIAISASQENLVDVVWRLIHPWCEFAIWGTLVKHEKFKTHKGPLLSKSWPGISAEGVEMPDFELSGDIVIRANIVGEGFAVFGTAAAIVKQMCVTGLYAGWPHRAQTIKNLATYAAIRTDYLSYGSGAKHLTGDSHGEMNDMFTDAMLADLCCFVRLVTRSTTMTKSGLYSRYKEYTPTPSWLALCTAYVRASQTTEVSADSIQIILRNASIIDVKEFSAVEEAQIRSLCGAHITATIGNTIVEMNGGEAGALDVDPDENDENQ